MECLGSAQVEHPGAEIGKEKHRVAFKFIQTGCEVTWNYPPGRLPPKQRALSYELACASRGSTYLPK